MKKILIVDQNEAHRNAATTFFSNISECEIVCCANKKDADQHFKWADAIITDSSIPYSGEKLFNASHPKDCKTTLCEKYLTVNGNCLFLSALFGENPAVLFIEKDHHVGIVSNVSTTTAGHYVRRYVYDIQCGGQTNYRFYTELQRLIHDRKVMNIEWFKFENEQLTSKTLPEAWNIAWLALKQQFKSVA